MTIANLCLVDDFRGVLIGVDSEIVIGASRLGQTTKVFYLSHLRAVICGRGHAGLPLAAFGTCCVQEQSVDRPAIFAAMLSQQFDLVVAAMSGIEDKAPDEAQEIIVAGWSDEHQRMRIFHFGQTARVDGFTPTEQEGFWVSPWDAEMGEPWAPDTLPEMIRLADLQHQTVRRLFGRTVAGGGELVVGCLTRDMFTSRVVKKWDD